MSYTFLTLMGTPVACAAEKHALTTGHAKFHQHSQRLLRTIGQHRYPRQALHVQSMALLSQV